MKCARAQNLFSSYAENAMEPPLRVAFEQHLAECSDCKARYEKFNATMMMLEEMPEVEVPAGFHAAVMARVARSRETAPRPVAWWHLDWQRVFTVRVPARALAMGLATVLVLGVAVQLTPLGTMTANLLFPPRSVQKQPVTIGADDPNAPKIGNSVCYPLPKSGLSVCVDTSAVGTARNSYELRFEVTGNQTVKFEVYMMPENATSPDAQGSLINSGFVRSKQGAAAGVAAGEASVARVDWQQDGKTYRQFVFLPSHFSAVAKSEDLSISGANAYQAFKQISESYGVVVIASGDLSKSVNYAGGKSQMPVDALFGVAGSAGFTYRGIAPCVFVVTPGS